MLMGRWKSVVLILGATLFAFASSTGVARPELTNHVIAADRDGIAIHPDTEEPFRTAAALLKGRTLQVVAALESLA